jgi:hypothetical protein
MLGEHDKVQPAGDYRVDTYEEVLGTVSSPVYRRVLTVIHLHANSIHLGHKEMLTINRDDLDAALMRDQAAANLDSEESA